MLRVGSVSFLPLIIVGITSSCVQDEPGETSAEAVSAVSARVTFSPSNDNFPNPERGIIIPFQPPGSSNPDNVVPLSTPGVIDYFKRERLRTGATMVRVVYVLDDWRSSAIPDAFLVRLADDFQALRGAGFKMVPLFVYNWPTEETDAIDATRERTTRHLTQLEPVLRANSDVIAFMIAGFIGAWGEWHNSTNNNISDTTGANANTRAILDAILSALPRERMTAIRYVSVKQQIYGGSPIAAAAAFDGSSRSRVGFHNDCFMSNRFGEQDRAQFHDYLRIEGLYVPHVAGFDVNCLSPGQNVPWSDLVSEAQVIGLDAIDDPDASRLTGTSRSDELRRRLGYRLRLEDAQVQTMARPGQPYAVTFTIANDGFSSLYNRRPVEIVLRHQTLGTVHVIESIEDPRRWQPGQQRTVAVSGILPAALPVGLYDVFLRLPDAAVHLRSRPAYAVRLANAGLWEPRSGLNKLYSGVAIKP